MKFSAYQIELLLENIQKEIFPMDKSSSEQLSLSDESIEGARKYLRTPKNPALAWIRPNDINNLVEDKTVYEPVIDQVQQYRAGRFVEPMYLPKNSAPSFPLVSERKKGNDKNPLPLEQKMVKDNKINNVIHNTNSDEYFLEKPNIELLAQVSENSIEKDELKSDDTFAITSDEPFDNLIDNSKKVPKDLIEKEQIDGIINEPVEENIDKKNNSESEELENTSSPSNFDSAASLFDGIEMDDEQDDDFDFESGGLQGENADDSDVVFGEGRIEIKSMTKFVSNYPDSTIKFLLRKNLDGRPLPSGYDEIYQNWETRGLSRGKLRKYLFKVMEWQDFPDIPVIEVVKKIREKHFDMKEVKK